MAQDAHKEAKQKELAEASITKDTRGVRTRPNTLLLGGARRPEHPVYLLHGRRGQQQQAWSTMTREPVMRKHGS